MTKVCANLLGSISRTLKQNAEWQMGMLDEARKPVFRIRLVANPSPEPIASAGLIATVLNGARRLATKS